MPKNTLDRMQQPKVLYVITQGILGGAQTHIRHLADHLKHNYEIHVAMGIKGPLWQALEEKGIQVHHLPSLVRPISPIKDYYGLCELIKLIAKIKPNLISTHSSKAGILGRFAAAYCGIPAIFTAHGWAFTEGIPFGKRYVYIVLEKIAAMYSRKIICVSDHDRQLAIKYRVGTPGQLVTICNGMPKVDIERMNSTKRETVRLVMVARFSEQKDHKLLFEAVRLIKSNCDFKIDLIGEGPLLKECTEMVQALELTDYINFLGERTDVPELLPNYDVFLLISNWEGLPRSILEAMRAGLPVIASNVGGTKETIVDGLTGFLVPRGDVHVLADRLTRTITDISLRTQMGEQSYNRFLQMFTFDRLLDETTQVYSEVLGGTEEQVCY